MAISIGGTGSQPVGEFIESTIDRVTSSQSNKVQEGAEASTSGSETTSLLAGASSLAALTATAMDSGGFRSDKVDQLRQAQRVAAASVGGRSRFQRLTAHENISPQVFPVKCRSTI